MRKMTLLSVGMTACFSLALCTGIFAQKKKSEPKLDKRKYDIEIREVTTEGKKYDKDVFEFSTKEIISDYFEAKFKIQTMHYKVVKDSTYTEDGDELKYWKITASEKNGKPEEEFRCEAVVAGKEISGKIRLMKGEAVKKTYEFEGTQNN